MIGSLYLVTLKGKKAIDLSQQRIRISLVMIMKRYQILLQELKLVLGDGLQHIFVIIREKEELPASSTLSLHKIKHLSCIIMQLE